MYSEGTVRVQQLLGSLVTAITTPLGETGSSNESTVTLTGSQTAVQLNMPNVGSGLSPSGWRIYKGTSSGSEEFLTQIPGNLTTFIDDGSLSVGSTTVPVSATGNLFALPGNPLGTLTNSALSTGFLSQSFTTTNASAKIAFDNAVGQPFFANHSLITEIDLPLDITGAPAGNVIVQIFPNTFNNPTPNTIHNIPNTGASAVALGSVTLPISSLNHFQTSGLYTKFTFSAPISVVVGTLYHIVVSLDTSANTIASGKFVNCAFLSELAGNTAVCPGINATFIGTSTVFTTGSWALFNALSFSSLNYKIFSTGTLSNGSYFYKVTASTGWSTVFTQQIQVTAANKFLTDMIFFSSGIHANESIFFVNNLNDNLNDSIGISILEYYDNQTHALRQFDATQATNGLGVAGTGKFFNSRNRPNNFYSAIQVNTVNVSFRIHTLADHVIMSLMGDSTIGTFLEYLTFVGKISSLNPTDNCYAISSDTDNSQTQGARWLPLRDFTNTVNTFLTSLLPIPNNGATGTSDTFLYLNAFTNNYDAITMNFSEANGFRGTAPNIILFPSNISNVINNHDTFTFNGFTYKLYILSNRRDFSTFFQNYIGLYNPAVKMI